MNKTARFSLVTTAIALGTLYAGAWRAEADFIQTNLVSDIPGLAAITDPELHNPWGISHSATSPFWVSNQGTNTTTLYAVTADNHVMKAAPMGTNGNIAIPPGGSGAVGPTGQVANTNTSSFPVGNGGNGTSAAFIFANLNGTISAWNGGQTAFIQVTTPGAVYTGLAINQAQTQLYAAKSAGGSVNVFNSSFQPVNNGAFATPAAISARNLVPFNVQTLNNGNVAVTYAPAGRPAQIAATRGMGAVAIFDATGATVLQTILGNPSNPASPSPRRGALLSPRPVSVRSAATCWSAISASSPARLTPSTRKRECSWARSRLTLAWATRQAAFGPSASGPGAATEAPTPSSSPMVSTARWTGCLAP